MTSTSSYPPTMTTKTTALSPSPSPPSSPDITWPSPRHCRDIPPPSASFACFSKRSCCWRARPSRCDVGRTATTTTTTTSFESPRGTSVDCCFVLLPMRWSRIPRGRRWRRIVGDDDDGDDGGRERDERRTSSRGAIISMERSGRTARSGSESRRGNRGNGLWQTRTQMKKKKKKKRREISERTRRGKSCLPRLDRMTRTTATMTTTERKRHTMTMALTRWMTI
mmetsp:Transcript_12389/g.26397  ORF Transcript_12389/g.26397 Transcript_12389/m.26397 type:complete len:224 (+) Transcript_12389:336-1007(+)